MEVVKTAIGDILITSMRITATPFSKLITTTIANSLNLQTQLSLFFISSIVSALIITIFGSISNFLGGASFNPATTVAFYSAGLTPTKPISLSIRFISQSAGAVVAVKLIYQIAPENTIKAPILKVDLHTGALAEGILTFGFCLILFFVVIKGPKNEFLRSYLVGLSIMGLGLIGGNYTGPSMNPANAFGWAYVQNWDNNWELYYVYWVGPLIGATMAGKVFAFLFLNPPLKKEKKA